MCQEFGQELLYKLTLVRSFLDLIAVWAHHHMTQLHYLTFLTDIPHFVPFPLPN